MEEKHGRETAYRKKITMRGHWTLIWRSDVVSRRNISIKGSSYTILMRVPNGGMILLTMYRSWGKAWRCRCYSKKFSPQRPNGNLITSDP